MFIDRTSAGPAPEQSIRDGDQVVGTGYSGTYLSFSFVGYLQFALLESKWVGERILELAAEKTALRPIIVRVGQICGGINGHWNTTEWFPNLVKSSLHLGALPRGDGVRVNYAYTSLESLTDCLSGYFLDSSSHGCPSINRDARCGSTDITSFSPTSRLMV